VAGIEEQRNVGALALEGEFAKPGSHFSATEVGSLNHVEADVAQHG
jgi:hypothetical protein